MLGKKKFDSKINFGNPNFFGPTKFLVQNDFGSKKILGRKRVLVKTSTYMQRA